ncbi:hypothetical protein PMIN06_011738 [Paraphaeosphaeria minitans]|uniref:Protein kinase domain-containing protein n=1 Tax=Paraphaeosphaeria minitans TaxID=565426 RepID=A0A9P6GPK9_9PLEO|nr:hypothetical protein PMIN01_03483 [Paraphaeosphaeria minitans]
MSPTMLSCSQPMPTNPQSFRRAFTFVRDIGCGTEGTVSRWENRTTGQVVALKVPRTPDRSKDLLAEIAALKKVPPQEHINNFLTYILQYEPVGPALVFELAEWGDVSKFRRTLLGHLDKVPEMTLWKFLLDMSLALDWLHNNMGEAHIHGDLKPENILVFSPTGWNGANDRLPTLPTFKISDIARMKPASANIKYHGTYEYGPPLPERERKQTPAADVWAIGASLQSFALGVMPVKSRVEYIKEKEKEGGYVPTLDDLRTEKWRKIIPHQYRPLNMSEEYQRYDMKIKPTAPYSFDLQRWYAALYAEDVSKRASSKWLVKKYVPYAQVKIHTMLREQEQNRVRQTFLREQEQRVERQRQILFQNRELRPRVPDVLQGAAAVLREPGTTREVRGGVSESCA